MTTVNTAIAPYNDDFDELKNFHRILFKPGVAVQARELTQIATILQNQIKRNGDHIFKQGSIVTGVPISVTNNYAFVKLKDRDSSNNYIVLSSFANATIRGLTSNVVATVIGSNTGTEAGAPNYNTLFIRYLDSGSSNTSTSFANGETIIVNSNSSINAVAIATGATGFGTAVAAGDGIIYAKGSYVRVGQQTLIVDKYSATPNAEIGFTINEYIVDSDEDATLLDQANTSNYFAPGADRLKYTANLVVKTANTTDMVTIVQLVNGQPLRAVARPDYAELGELLARRTYDESGNYTLNPINVSIREHLANSSNRGVYSGNTGDANSLVVVAEPGTAYVAGFYHKFLEPSLVVIDKALTTREVNAQQIQPTYGNYLIVENLIGQWNVNDIDSVALYDAAANAFNVISGAGSPSTSGNQIGTAKIRNVEYYAGTMGYANCQYKLYLSDINVTSNASPFALVRSVYYNASSGQDGFADAVLTSNAATLQETSFDTLVFPFGQAAIKHLRDSANTNDTQYVHRKSQNFTMEADGDVLITLTGSATGGTEKIAYDAGALTSAEKNEVLIIPTAAGQASANKTGTVTATAGSNVISGSGTSFDTEYVVGDWIRLPTLSEHYYITAVTNATSISVSENVTSNGSANIHTLYFPAGVPINMATHSRAITVNSNTTFTIDINETLSGTMDAVVHFNVSRTGAVQAKKNVRRNRYVIANTEPAGPWNLGVSDVLRINAVYNGNTTSNTDITTEFTLDNGQRDGFYEHGRLRLNANSALTPANNILIDLDYFEHSTAQGIGFFSVDSYQDDIANSNFTIQEIPTFTSPTSGRLYDLRDCVDFRPRRTDDVTPNANAASAPLAPPRASENVTFFTPAASSYLPVSGSTFQADLEYYLGRIDKLFLTKDGNYHVVSGEAAEIPKAPADLSEDNMLIATLNIPPFPSLSMFVARQYNREDYAVTINRKNNRRYTMSDIRTLDNRISRVEYYTALSFLEKSANDKQITDALGQDRFKNGFLVDPFVGHNVGSAFDPNYRISIDSQRREARPVQRVQEIDLEYNSSNSSSVTLNSSLITLPYTEVTYTEQPYASKGRKAAGDLTFVWKGNVSLNPPMDHWIDDQRLPEITVDLSNYSEAIAKIGEWTGFRNESWSTIARNQGRVVETTNNNTVTTSRTDTITQQRVVEQISVDLENTTEQTLGDRIVDVNIIPFMRSRVIQVTGSNLRPSTRFYAYFDGDSVDEFVAPANSSFGATGDEGDPVYSNANGFYYALYRIPENRFLTGDRVFRITNQANTTTDVLSATGSATYTSQGLATVSQETILSTAPVSVTSSAETRTITDTVVLGVRTIRQENTELGSFGDRGFDPISQTFVVENLASGIFVTSLDLFFKEKSSTYGVTVELREVYNGFPSPTVVPYGTKYLPTGSINANSTSANTATTFTFDNPVFLKTNTEYCFVVKPEGNNLETELWVSELGGLDVDTNLLISQQPHVGILFTSSNDRGWTPYQTEDIKFTLKRADFSATSGTVVLDNANIDYFTVTSVALDALRIGETVYGEVEIEANNVTNIGVGDVLTQANSGALGVIRAISGNTVTVDPKGTFDLSVVVANSQSKTITSVSTPSSGTVLYYNTTTNKVFITSSTSNWTANTIATDGYFRGQTTNTAVQITSVDNLQMDQLYSFIPSLTFGDASVTWTYKDGSNNTPIIANETYTFTNSSKTVNSASNESGTKSLRLTGSLTSTKTHLSPAIDTAALGATIIGNLINNAAANTEYTDGGGALTRYITKKVELADGQDAEDLVIFLAGYKPAGTDIYVYAKLLNSSDGETFADKNWTQLSQVTAASTYSSVANINDYREFEYRLPEGTSSGQDPLNAFLNTDNSNIVRYFDSNGVPYDGFKVFAVKIVLVSTTTHIVPKIKDFRAIALQV